MQILIDDNQERQRIVTLRSNGRGEDDEETIFIQDAPEIYSTVYLRGNDGSMQGKVLIWDEI